MEFSKTANYNIRYVDVIDMESMTIDLTPEEVGRSNGKILYILRISSESSRFSYGYCTSVNMNDGNIFFMAALVGELQVLTFVADTDDSYYHVAQ